MKNIKLILEIGNNKMFISILDSMLCMFYSLIMAKWVNRGINHKFLDENILMHNDKYLYYKQAFKFFDYRVMIMYLILNKGKNATKFRKSLNLQCNLY